MTALAGVARELARASASVGEVRDATLLLAAERDPLASGDLGALRPLVARLLRRHDGFVAGAGVVLAPGVLGDRERWIEWWFADRGAGPERLEVDLDARSPDFFDYTTAEWYAAPERTRAPAVSGPYVDYICTHEVTFTLSLPLLARGRFLGVAAADVLAAQVERAVLPELARRGRPTVLASSDGRVIASNDAAFAPGVALARRADARELVPVESAGDLPWALLERR